MFLNVDGETTPSTDHRPLTTDHRRRGTDHGPRRWETDD
ncbi:MAG: hypothetical protein AVDCRST_MAG93-6954 [uncultured Chloroflexia bacterium]|uniref:Uncharacterized protein n=1 Tax=uncultured Chloroflexia bacterium TaxID=1672391 RepID=A0A6J4M3R8_9CHLR|nr:MAG: hypothetical protein AVDCRST_MAG93-6954 [uncultured Chloroflexia bacterium]